MEDRELRKEILEVTNILKWTSKKLEEKIARIRQLLEEEYQDIGENPT